MQISRDEFEALVSDALDEIPTEFTEQLANIVVLVEDEPPPESADCLGVYEGVPLTERWGGEPFEPDRILLFAGPLARYCRDVEELRHEIRVTVIHEIAHYFGIAEERLDELGWA